MLEEQAAAWDKKWQHNDIIIEGDASAQQGIRFNIFPAESELMPGEDDRLNIGPKGFTGEKYGGLFNLLGYGSLLLRAVSTQRRGSKSYP